VIQVWEARLAPDGAVHDEPVRLTSDAAPKFGVTLSRDGTRLAYSSYPGKAGQTELRLRELATGVETQVTTAAGDRVDLGAVLDASGDLAAYEDDVDGRPATFTRRIGDATGREVCRDCGPMAFFPGGQEVVVARGSRQLARRDLETGVERVILRTDSLAVLGGDLAPDGRRLALVAGSPDRTMSVRALSLREGGATERDLVPLVEDRGWLWSPRWSADGSRLYYLSDRDGFVCIWMRRVDRASGRPWASPSWPCTVTARPGDARSDLGLELRRRRRPSRLNAADVRGNAWAARLEPR
jgi:Periplasmic component of the Tol biopolymer transport system